MSDNEKKYVKIPLSTAIFLIIIIILVMALIILGIYTYGLQNNVNSSISSENQNSDQNSDYLLTTENVTSNDKNLTSANSASTTTTTTNSTSNSTTSKSLDINSEQVTKLYSYVLKYDSTDNGSSFDHDVNGNTNPTSFYKESKVTYDNLSNAEKIFAVLQSYGESGVKNVPLGNLTNVITVPAEFVQYYSKENVKVYENVGETAKKIFGKNTDINWRSYGGIGQLEYKNNNYYSYAIQAGGLGLTNRAYSKIIKAEQSGNNIYIYDNFIWYDEYNSIVNGDSYDYLYKSAGKTSLIAKEKSTSSDNVDGNALIAKYKDKLYTYKHTFQKASDGSYYWVSTEPVK